VRKAGGAIWRVLQVFGLDQKLVAFVIVPVCVLVGAFIMREYQVATGDKSGQRPGANNKSAADQAGAVVGSLAERAGKAISEVTAEFSARSTGEALCFLAGKGNLEAVQYLLDRGQAVNSLDRNGRTPLMHAAGGGHLEIVELLLKKEGIEVGRQDDWGDNAYVHALSNQRAPSILPVLKRAGLDCPAFDQVAAGGKALSAPAEIKEGDVQDWGAVLQLAGDRYRSSDDLIPTNNDTLVRAIQTIDCGEQVNEPEIQEAAQAERRRLGLLLINRVIGSRTRAMALYERDRYRHTKLPKPVMDQVKVLRGLAVAPAAGASEADGYATATIMATRRLNAMMLHWMLGKAVRIPLDVEFATREEEEAAAQAAKEKAEREAREEAERAAAEASYQRPYWTSEPLKDTELMGLSLTQVQDMINELLASAGQRFPDDARNDLYRRKGYRQQDENPTLTTVQKKNLRLLTDERSRLRKASP